MTSWLKADIDNLFFAELTVLSSPSLPSLIYFLGYFGDSNSELNIEYWSLWEVFKSRQIGFRRTHFNASLVSRQLFQCITLFLNHCTALWDIPKVFRIQIESSYNCRRGSTEKGRGRGSLRFNARIQDYAPTLWQKKYHKSNSYVTQNWCNLTHINFVNQPTQSVTKHKQLVWFLRVIGQSAQWKLRIQWRW